MKIKGKLVAEMQIQSGVSASGKEWRSKTYVLEVGYYNGIPKFVAFQIMGDKIEEFPMIQGREYEVDIDISAREWNGKWFNSVTAWRCADLSSNGTQPATAQQPAQQPAPSQTPQQTAQAKVMANPAVQNMASALNDNNNPDALPF